EPPPPPLPPPEPPELPEPPPLHAASTMDSARANARTKDACFLIPCTLPFVSVSVRSAYKLAPERAGRLSTNRTTFFKNLAFLLGAVRSAHEKNVPGMLPETLPGASDAIS